MSDPMEYLQQAKANLAAMQDAVAAQTQQEQMAMILRERPLRDRRAQNR